MNVSTEMIRKYMLEALLNWKSKDRGIQEKIVYLVILTLFVFLELSYYFPSSP